MEDYVLVQFNDWVELWEGDEIIAEGHSLAPFHIFDALGLSLEIFEGIENEYEEPESKTPTELRNMQDEGY